MALWLDAVSTGVGVVTLAFAALLAWRGRSTASTWILGSWLFLLGLFYLLTGLGESVGLSEFQRTWLTFLTGFPRPFLVAAFGFVFLRLVLDRGTKLVLAMLAAVALVQGVATFTAPSLFILPDGRPTAVMANIMGIVIGGSYVIAVGALGWRWLRARAGEYRRQLLWGLLPFLFWTIHDGIGFGLLPALLGTRESALAPWFFLHQPDLAVLLVWLVGLSFAVVLLAAAFLRVAREPHPAPDARVLLFAGLYTIPVALVQLFEPGLHIPIDALIVPIIAYGVVRHQVLDVDVRLRWTISKGTVAGAILAGFFLVSEFAVEILAVDGARWLGILGAGLVVFAISPLQRFADRFSQATLPHVRDRAAHLDARVREIYRVAAEELLVDGHVTGKERAALVRLRAQIGLDAATAARLEAEVKAAVPTPP